MIDYKTGMEVLKHLVDESKININQDIYRNYLAFAMKGDRLDYQMLLESIKHRSSAIADFPKRQVF